MNVCLIYNDEVQGLGTCYQGWLCLGLRQNQEQTKT